MGTSVKKDGLLAGKVAVITGASRGIGAAIAYRYAQEGASIVVSARTVREGDHFLSGSINSVVDCINNADGQAYGVKADLSNEEDRINLIEQAYSVYGSVDILVNNAAVTYFAPVRDFTQKHFELMMSVQVYGAFHLCQLVLPAMIESQSGRILNISSHAALHPQVDSGSGSSTVYGMCKATLERFTTGLASDLYSENIGVNAISPGLVATPGVKFHKLINERNENNVTPIEHIAEASLRLVYGNAQDMTGRITYAAEILEEFSLQPVQLIGST